MKKLLPLFILIFTFTSYGNWFSSEKPLSIIQIDGCTYSVPTDSISVPPNGGNRSFGITTQSGCTWTAVSNKPWITITSNASGIGSGTISFSISFNPGEQRYGTISIANQTFSIFQTTNCTFSSSPNIQNIGADGGTISINVTTQAGCTWTSSVQGNGLSWVTITSGNSGTGNGTVTYRVEPNTGDNRSATLTIAAGANFLFQASPCSISPINQSFTSSGGIGTVNISTVSPCNWTARVIQGHSWITITNDTSGTGNGSVTFTVAPNAGPARTGGIQVAGQGVTINQSSGCAFQLSSNGTSFPSIGGSGTFNLTSSDAECSSTATKNVSWITIDSGSSGNGNRTISYTVQANTGPPRTGTITVGGQTFTVSQASGCSYTLTATSINVAQSGGSGSFTINSSVVCSWTAVSNVPWITISSGSSGSGSGTVNFSIQANTGVARNGTITAGGQTFSVNQAAGSECTYSLSSNSANSPANGGNGTVNVTTDAGCSWSALSNVPWIITFANGNNIGNGAVTYSVAANTGPARSGTITIAGKTFAITQESGECSYSLSNSDIFIVPNGGTAGVNVTAGVGCTWTAISNSPWIIVTSGANGSGNGTVGFSVASNTGTGRIGSITIGGQTLAVSQSSGCTITVPSETLTFSAAGGAGTFAVSAPDGCTWTANSTVSWITITNGGSSVSFTVRVNTGLARTGTINVGGQTVTVSQAAGEIKRVAYDFDGDGKSDFSIYRPSVGEWWYLKSSTGGNGAYQFGTSSDKIVPADYTGDGITDGAFYRPSTGEWFILRSNDFSYYAFPFGISSDIPIPADYDGDGKTDPAVYRPSTNIWYILKSTGGVTIDQMGITGDVPVVADYDGDGRADIGVYRPSNGKWQIQRTTAGAVEYQFGTSTDKPVQADYDGDGKADAAYYRPSTGEWFVLRSNGTTFLTQFGTTGDIPTPADFDGDGKTDIAIYRPSTTDWWYMASASNGQQRAAQFGSSTDLPVPSAYIP